MKGLTTIENCWFIVDIVVVAHLLDITGLCIVVPKNLASRKSPIALHKAPKVDLSFF